MRPKNQQIANRNANILYFLHLFFSNLGQTGVIETTVKKMESKEKGGSTDTAGVPRDWLKAVISDRVEKPGEWTEKKAKATGPRKADSRIQQILQQFYWDLVDGLKEVKFTAEGEVITQPDGDMFDKWYENMGLEKYTQKPKLMNIFNTIIRGLHLKQKDGYTEDDFQSLLSDIVERCIVEPEYVDKVADIINEVYPNLASPFRAAPTVEEMQDYEKLLYRRRLDQELSKIETNIDDFSEELEKIKAAAKTNFERLARRLNKIVIFGADAWELILYCIMSPFAPRVLINGLDYRPNVHAMLAGDIATAKSKILKIAKYISPKMLVVDETTKPTFEGVAPTRSGDDIEEGVIDWANDGLMIVEEFTRQFASMSLFRRVMDGEFIQFFKKGSVKGTYTNITMLTACNPKDDFFQTEIYLRKQLPFKEGILSRFDILLPLTATQINNEIIIDQMDFFGNKLENPLDFKEIKERLTYLAVGMREIKTVVLTEEQKEMLRAAFKDHNTIDRRRQILKNRPLLTLRDAESLARFINIITTTKFSRRRVEEVQGEKILFAEDEDIEKAIQLWENLLHFRIQLYARMSRNLTSLSDEILIYLTQAGASEAWMPLSDVYSQFVDTLHRTKRSTFFKEVAGLIESKRIISRGKRNREVRLIVK